VHYSRQEQHQKAKQGIMVPSSTAPARILVATCLDEDDAKELLSWAIRILSHPNDTIIALHVLGQFNYVFMELITS